MDENEIEEIWKNNFNNSLKSVRRMITPQPHDNDYIKSSKEFMKWIIQGEEDPYVFLPKDFCDLRNSLEKTSSFLSILYHSLIDEGYVSFVTLKFNNEIKSVKLIFCDQNMDNFRDIVLNEHSSLIQTEQNIYKRSVDFTNQINEMFLKEGKPLKQSIKEFKVDELEIISHKDHNKFKQEVIDFIKQEKEKIIELENKKNNLLGKLFKP